MRRRVVFIICASLITLVNASITILAQNQYHGEQMARSSPGRYEVSCQNCDVLVMSFNDYSSLQANLPYQYMTAYSIKSATGTVSRTNIRIYQNAYFVIINRAPFTDTITYTLEYDPTYPPVPTASTPPIHHIAIWIPLSVCVLLFITIVICVVCLRRSMRRNAANAYTQVTAPIVQTPLYQQAQTTYEQPLYQQPIYVQQPIYQQTYPQQTYSQQPYYAHTPYQQQPPVQQQQHAYINSYGTTPSAPTYNI
jgi:hypothetical protein